MSKKDLWIGVAAGAGAVLAAPLVLPVVGAIVRPLLRETLKVGFIAAELARTRGAFALETLEDIVAEAREDARIALEERAEEEEAGAPSERAVPGDGAASRRRS